MNEERLYKVIGMIDSDYIDEAADVKNDVQRRARWIAACVAAAALCMVCIAALPFERETDEVRLSETPDAEIVGSERNEDGLQEDCYSLILNTADAQCARMDAGLQFSCELDAEQIDDVLPGLAELGEVAAEAVYDSDGGLKSVLAGIISNGEQLSEAVEAHVRLFPASEDAVTDYVFCCEPQPSFIMGQRIMAGQYALTDSTVYFATFNHNDSAYYVELTGGNAEKSALPALIDLILCSDAADFSCLSEPVIPELRDDELSEEQAYGDKIYGKHLPEVSVNGLDFEYARRYKNQQSDYLRVLWSQWRTQGMDQLYITLSTVSEHDVQRTVEPEETEKYDLSLYPIPRGESVPEELWEVVNDPVFRAEQLTREMVRARAYVVNEAGDSDGFRMRFSVLHNDVLIQIESKGQTPEQIYDIINAAYINQNGGW